MKHRQLDAACGPLLANDDGHVTTARGIPYATAERFTMPVPAPRWAETLDATKRGPACPQLPSRLESVTGPVVDGLATDEQCLVVSVTAPTGALNLPVMVWFHGGAYMSGSGEAPKYDPGALALEGGVVVVTVSYRLGIFGYLNLVPGGQPNLGLRDQILALRWIKHNITAFGGDPSRVTIFGQSAGGDSVLSLILSEETSGLFGRAILHSAPLGLRHGRTAMSAAMRAAAIAALDGCDPLDASVDQLLTGQTAAVTAAQRFGPLGGFPFAPVAGADPMPANKDEHRVFTRRATEIDILVGFTRRDAAAFAAMDPRAVKLQRRGAVGRAATDLLIGVMTRRIFGRPARQLAETWTSNGGDAAMFRVDWSPPDAPLGPCHCIELPLLFASPNCWSDAPMLGPHSAPIDGGLAHKMRTQWAAFAHNGIAALNSSSLRI